MKKKKTIPVGLLLGVLLLAAAGTVHAQDHGSSMDGMIDGETGMLMDVGGVVTRVFHVSTGATHISTPEGNSIYVWGYAGHSGMVQYPGPTLIVNQGDAVEIRLSNTLPDPVSIVFPGQAVTAAGDPGATQPGALTLEALPGGMAIYRFTADRPGTYLYSSGTDQALQVELGLFGALIVRPTGFDPMMPTAYGHPDSAYDREYLFLLSEIDPVVHRLVELGRKDSVDLNGFFPVYWFINGRASPDTMFESHAAWLPAQPYNSMPMMYPGQRVLFRVIGGGRDLHPLHTHGNHTRVIAKDAVPLDLPAPAGETDELLDLTYDVFTVQSVPGQTVDAIFTWTGEGIGWDIYGHAPEDELESAEYEPDHGKPFPVFIPEKGNLTFGGFWSGSPFLGSMGDLPPGEGGLNPMSGFVYMIHSHTEKEMTNNNIFPGGLMTMIMIMPPEETMEPPPLTPGESPLLSREEGDYR